MQGFVIFTSMYYVYAISSLSKKYIYVGITDNPDRRIHQHNSGYEKTTKPYIPFKTILIEEFDDRPAARKREIFLKSTSGKRLLYKILETSAGLPD
jgi:putative endonuclease